MSKTTDRLKNAGNSVLKAAALAAQLGPMTRMTELEYEIDRLQEEYAVLNEKLEPSRRRPIPYKK